MPRLSVGEETARELALVAMFAEIVAAFGLISPAFIVRGFSVPITAQTLGVMLAGAVLGARRASQALVEATEGSF